MPNIIVFHTAWMTKYGGDRVSMSAGGFSMAARVTSVANLETPE
ncbi:hypothetical protein [Rhizobium sp. S96]|nr:hypothetical protein [Rhizobium sp. S96]MDM9621102.1 hypothetical protein [Rhizobium sp. S96]